jgi:lysyl-tRNA synthetase class I
MTRVLESGMVFEFAEDKIFQLEGSELHRSVGDGIKTVEFVACLQKNKLLFVEAKSSSPKPEKDNQVNFDKYISEIADKFIHSFDLYLSAMLERHQPHRITGHVSEQDHGQEQYQFVLVINGHQTEWLQPIKEALEKKIMFHRKIWRSDVVLMNEVVAQTHKLVKEVPSHA